MKSPNVLEGIPLESARRILKETRDRIQKVAAGDSELEFRLRRYVYIRLTYDERGNPQTRKLLKMKKFDEQKGACGLCEKPLEQIGYSELDRKKASLGYTVSNTRLVHPNCHREQQKQRNYT